MKRILLLLTCAGLVVLSACTSSTGGTASVRSAGNETGNKPNFVFVLTDDLAWNLISRMPQVQALQKQGTTFSNYYVVDSLCCPSRSAIFTGQYPHDDGVFTNSGDDGGYAAYNKNGDQPKSFAVALQKAGYRTGMMGKYLNGYQPSNPIPPGWNEWDVAGNGYPEFNYTLNENGKQRHYGHDPKDYLVDVLSGKAAKFIDDSADKPFALEVATFAPHAPYTPAPRYKHAAKNVAYPTTAAYDTLPTDPPSWLKNRASLTPKQQKQITTAYRKRVAADLAVNDMIGHLERELTAKGVAKNTYFVFSSDNGYHMGEYRLLPGKQTAYDTDIHVPLVMAGPGVPAGRTTDQMASNIDLCPTFEDLGGAHPTGTPDGVSLAPLLHGQRPDNWQRAVLIEHHGPNDRPGDPDRQNARHADPPSYEAVRTANALYVRYSNGAQEYYDTAHDPLELHNLAGRGVPPDLPKTLNALSHCHDAKACQAAAR